jgi:putative molybdopterin biosynthesis protein
MNRISVKPTWVVENEAGTRLGAELFGMLSALHDTGKLTAAAVRLGISYRHAWNLLEGWNGFFGVPLVRFERGKGTTLTTLGEKLLWAEQRASARLGPQMESLASELNLEINRLVATAASTIRVHASHGFAVARLPDLLRESSHIQLDLRYLGSVESLASLTRGECDLAGFHVPEGHLGTQALARYARWLQPAKQRLIHLVTRTQGLFVAKGNPKGIHGLADLARDDVTFVNRQKGAGTRLLLDQLLDDAGVEREDIHGYRTEEFTHAAVAAFVASGMADVAFGVEPPARQFRLDFVPIAKEQYFLLTLVRTLERPEIRDLLALLRGSAFDALVADLPGYAAPLAGEVATIAEVFPDFDTVAAPG